MRDTVPAATSPGPSADPSPAARAAAGGWAERGVGQDWQHRFFFCVLRWAGKRVAYLVLDFVALGYVLLFPGVRRRTRHYLDRRFPGRRGPWASCLDSFRLVRSFGQTLLDMAVCQVRGPGCLAVSCPDADELVRLSRAGTGLVLVNAHVGCWQVAMSVLRELNLPVSLVMVPSERGLVEQSVSCRVIDPRQGLGSVLEIMQALQRKEVVGLMGDRVFGGEGSTVSASFLGGEVALPFSPYRVAAATGAPIVVILAWKTGYAAYQIRLANVLRLPPDLGRDPLAYRPWAQAFADTLAAFVAEHPWQFYNFFDLWDTAGTAAGDRQSRRAPRASAD